MLVPRPAILASAHLCALLALGSPLGAQTLTPESGAVGTPVQSAAAPLFARPAPVLLPEFLECDGQAVQAAERKRSRGKRLMIGGAAATVLLYGVAYSGSGSYGSLSLLGLVSAVGGALGYYWYAFSDDPAAWDQALRGFSVGVSTEEDVRTCLGEPWVVTTNGGRETWSYMASRPGFLFGGTAQTVRVMLENDVVVEVETSRVGR